MRTTVFVRASCLLALCASLLLPACGGEDRGAQLKKPDFPFGGFRLTNRDVDKKDVTAKLDVGGTQHDFDPSPIKVDQTGVAPAAVVLNVAAVTLSMKVGSDSSARAKEWKASEHGGVYIKGVTLTYTEKEGQPYKVKGKIVVYTDATDPSKTKISDIDTSV